MSHKGRESADERLAFALASGKTVRDAAVDAGVSEKTAHRRNSDPMFRAAVSSARANIMATAAGRLADGMTAATIVLRNLMEESRPELKLRAAVKILELAVKVNDASILQSEVADLRRAVDLINRPPEGGVSVLAK